MGDGEMQPLSRIVSGLQKKRDLLESEGALLTTAEFCPGCNRPMFELPGVPEKVARAVALTADQDDPRAMTMGVSSHRCLCGERREAAGAAAYAAAGLPDDGEPRTFDNFTGRGGGTEEALEAARVFAAFEGPRILTLSGPVGSGKSHLLEAIARRILERGGGPVRRERVPNFVRRMRAEQLTGNESFMAAWRAQHLLLDDLGAQRETDFVNEQLFDIIDERLDGERPDARLALATNLLWKEMDNEGRNARTASRVFAVKDPHVKVVYLSAADYRRSR
jgi:DNA replication protein DnaC